MKIINRSETIRLGITLVVVCSSLVFFAGNSLAAALTLGPFKLGMTNAEAARVSTLSDCHPDGDKMECTGLLRTTTLDEKVKLRF